MKNGSSPTEVCKVAGWCASNVEENWVLNDIHYPLFVSFMKDFNKKYKTEADQINRAKIFIANLKRIKRLERYAASVQSHAQFGITELADLSFVEFKATMLSNIKPIIKPDDPVAIPDESRVKALPDSFDWRTKGAVTPIKNQGQCGSCWAFSTTGNVEGQWFLAGNKLVGLSEQNLVDCDHECTIYDGQKSCDAGCDGGLQPNAYTYIMKNNGIDSEASYPYTCEDGTCQFNSANVAARIKNFTMVSQNETLMAVYLVDHGPLAIAADAVEWQFYIGGVFDFPCGKNLDHGILIVGYGTEVDILGFHIPFWWIKNSWGTSWGYSGYMKLKRGDGKCGCNTYVSSSIVN